MRIKIEMDDEEYQQSLNHLKSVIYHYARKKRVNINDKEELIKSCSTIEKLEFDKIDIYILLDGIMNPEIGDQRLLKFIDLEGISFDDRDVSGIDFRGTNADIDPQTVLNKNLEFANFEGIDMSEKDFSGCNLRHCNLTNTNAVLKLSKLDVNNLWGTKLEGTTLLVGEYFDREKLEKQSVTLGEVREDQFTTVRKHIKMLDYKIKNKRPRNY